MVNTFFNYICLGKCKHSCSVRQLSHGRPIPLFADLCQGEGDSTSVIRVRRVVLNRRSSVCIWGERVSRRWNLYVYVSCFACFCLNPTQTLNCNRHPTCGLSMMVKVIHTYIHTYIFFPSDTLAPVRGVPYNGYLPTPSPGEPWRVSVFDCLVLPLRIFSKTLSGKIKMP